MSIFLSFSFFTATPPCRQACACVCCRKRRRDNHDDDARCRRRDAGRVRHVALLLRVLREIQQLVRRRRRAVPQQPHPGHRSTVQSCRPILQGLSSSPSPALVSYRGLGSGGSHAMGPGGTGPPGSWLDLPKFSSTLDTLWSIDSLKIVNLMPPDVRF